ncbi:MAG: DUF2867 domain-containing protein [Chloroflexota bacterium]
MNKEEFLQLAPELGPIFTNADHIDIKTEASNNPLRSFMVGALSYHPRWMKFLYGIRYYFVRLLGMTQEGMPEALQLNEEDISMTPGEWVTFFQVTQAKEDAYWVGEATEKHLTAYLAIAVDDSQAEQLVHLATVVKYNHWTGPVYFNVIRPFHHIVVRQMMRAAAKYTPAMTTA